MNTKAWLVAAVTASIVFIGAPGIDAAQAQTASNLKCKGCVGKKDLGKKAIKEKHLKDGAVSMAKLADDAQPAGVDFGNSLSGALAAAGGEMQLVEIVLDVPGTGYVVAIASGYIEFLGALNTAACSISEHGSVEETEAIKVTGESVAGDNELYPLSQTRTFAVTGETIRLYFTCKLSGIGTGAATANNTDLTAFFVPNRY
jgi:hypothetical protein